MRDVAHSRPSRTSALDPVSREPRGDSNDYDWRFERPLRRCQPLAIRPREAQERHQLVCKIRRTDSAARLYDARAYDLRRYNRHTRASAGGCRQRSSVSSAIALLAQILVCLFDRFARSTVPLPCWKRRAEVSSILTRSTFLSAGIVERIYKPTSATKLLPCKAGVRRGGRRRCTVGV